uniref:KOW domain-containing protein n=1 Tax=Periophthalmus magnuspinnatus TaxID=409849 RepID=A0A3B4AX78_9GOBI
MFFSSFATGSLSPVRKRSSSLPTSHVRRKITSKELHQKNNVRSVNIRKDDEVQVVREIYEGQQFGRVVQRVQREKVSVTTVHVGIHPSNVKIPERKAKCQADGKESKYKEETIEKMQE